MAKLSVTLIDVGWGDSILIESVRNNGSRTFALIDSNDSTYYRSSFIFLKKYFERKRINLSNNRRLFRFVMLSHFHTDHGQGLKAIMRKFGTKYFFYPKTDDSGSLASLIRYANRSNKVQHHQSVDSTKNFPRLGDATVSALWPRHDQISSHENNNSIVLKLTLNNVSFLLTGDAEKEVWDQIANDLPNDIQFFKVPHHGSVNGTFDGSRPVWINDLPNTTCLGISAHVRPFGHPHSEVVRLFDNEGRTSYRTDENYHVTFETNGSNLKVKYSNQEQII